MNCHEDQIDGEIRESASALLDITNGYPLHVIYSSEFLSHHGLPLSSWEIGKLPPCSDGDIVSYYSELWRNLNYRQQDVLHLCSGFQFAWPRQAVGTVVKDEHDYSPSVDAVAHMLSEGKTGVRPFHESLVVFVRNQKEHQDRINALLPDVCQWLSSEAPPHLKDNWLWSSLARAGDSTQLRQGVTRDWLLDRLIIGMPVKSCIRLLSEAETYAFEELKYAEACRHRELKTRLLIRSLCGTFTAVENNKRSSWRQSDKKREQLFVCKATILQSEDSHREFKTETHNFRVSCKGIDPVKK